MGEITNQDLRLEDIPLEDADWSAIGRFVLTFNGYEYWGSFEKCGEVASAHSHDALAGLRTCLFFEQRRWRHFGYAPMKRR